MADVTNADRAEFARAGVHAYAMRTRHRVPANQNELDEAAGDMLGDLRHLLGPEVFDALAERGLSYYTEETEEERADVG